MSYIIQFLKNDLFFSSKFVISILGNKNESRRNFANNENYKAIRILQTCGFVKAAHTWLDCFPKK